MGSSKPRVVLVHGFTQTGRSWDDVAAHLEDRFEVVRVDLPGHGASSELRLDFADAASAIGDSGGRATYAGYSMGGRLCLRLAVDRPELVRSLVLIGASPGLADPAARAERRRADARLAADLEADGTSEFLVRWLAQPMFETTGTAFGHAAGTAFGHAAGTASGPAAGPRPADLEGRRANSASGLAYALRRLGTGSQEPLWDRLRELTMPVLLVAGGTDAKFRDIAERMAVAIGPTARTAWVEGAGHAVILDQPEACARLIAESAAHAATR